jgi:ERCC4-related helicase
MIYLFGIILNDKKLPLLCGFHKPCSYIHGMKKDMYDLIMREKGKDEVSFQREILTNPNYENPQSPLVIAVGTGGGKTLMTVIKLDMFYRIHQNRGKRTLICPSSTKVLRSNFEEELRNYNPSFSYAICKNRKDFIEAMDNGKEVIICLPQTLNNIQNLPKVEWLVVDEAHKWYFAKVMQKIISRCKPKYQWLLTGTLLNLIYINSKILKVL